jgi:salicylate hydroxylase
MQGSIRVAVVGAGLGGLTAALALRYKGFDVTVFEQAATIREVGAGIQLSPNAMRVFAQLGLDDEIKRIAFEPDSHVVRNWKTGAAISETSMKGVYEKTYGAGYYGMHRADLQTFLAAAFPQERIKLGKKCIGLAMSDNCGLRFEDGTTVESDVVVGADGIHSVVREQLFGPQPARFTGNICWRGLVPTDALPKGLVPTDMSAFFGPRASLVTYYVRGGEYVNWIAMAEEDSWRSESWSIEVDPAEVASRYDGWCPIVGQLLAATQRCNKWALFDRDPLPHWTKGRATLAGDAAHPMVPYLAQGACMAIEDGYALATLLAKTPGAPEAALQAYEVARRPRTTRVQLTARARSKINHVASPQAQLMRNIGYAIQKLIKPSGHAYKIEWIYGYDVTTALG